MASQLAQAKASDDINIVELMDVLDRLKHLKRTGWVHYRVPEPETVASHMYRMAVLTMALKTRPQDASGEGAAPLDIVNCMKMALVHDIGEAIVGDITSRCGVSNDEKFRLEEKAVAEIASHVPAWVGDEWRALWAEYESVTTPEACVVKQLDKFDMLAQAFAYERRHRDIDLSEFFTSTPSTVFTTAPFVTWDARLRADRDVWRAANPPPSVDHE